MGFLLSVPHVCNRSYTYSFIGRKEGTVNSSSSYYIFSRGQDGAFEAIPVSNW